MITGFFDKSDFFGYYDREFHKPHNINNNYNCFNTFQHIKTKLQTKNYIMLDIDNIEISKVNFLFCNDFITPNFYIYEYSKKKQCYTLQVFILLDNDLVINDKVVENYKKICWLFGADMQYQIKTGIHKNPDFKDYEQINIDMFNIKIKQKNHTGFLHSNKHNFDAIIHNLDYFCYFDNYKTEKITVKIKPVQDQKPTNKENKKELGTRNITLFNETRLIAYSINDKSYDNILHIANKINNSFTNKLKQNEVNKTAKSIYNFINKEFKNQTVDPYSDIQRFKSIETRATKAIEKIAMAIVELVNNKKSITQTAIRKITKQKPEQIKLHWDNARMLAVELANNTNPEPQNQVTILPIIVNSEQKITQKPRPIKEILSDDVMNLTTAEMRKLYFYKNKKPIIKKRTQSIKIPTEYKNSFS